MAVVDLSVSKKKALANHTDTLGDEIRQQTLIYAKDFKVAWLNFARHLFSIWEDKMYMGWGYNKFEEYVEKEIGFNKSLALKLVKSYIFLENDEPQYLADSFFDDREVNNIPGYEEINVLRTAKAKKELTKSDYEHLRKAVFDKGKEAAEVRKDLTALIKERKKIDPEEERNNRHLVAVRKMINSLRSFKKDMEALKIGSADILNDTDELLARLQEEID
ncbi:MAG: hypothetical protein HQL25_08585 [Candidatus Omnitrophica bacterium]|nr:hypothetical protein [Candidatus Omnitrophota bacterium]